MPQLKFLTRINFKPSSGRVRRNSMLPTQQEHQVAGVLSFSVFKKTIMFHSEPSNMGTPSVSELAIKSSMEPKSLRSPTSQTEFSTTLWSTLYLLQISLLLLCPKPLILGLHISHFSILALEIRNCLKLAKLKPTLQLITQQVQLSITRGVCHSNLILQTSAI
jgi:hypothetical protein